MSRPAHTHRPPMRDGVSASCVATPSGPWPLLLDFLAERLSVLTRQEWHERMHQGLVLGPSGQPLPPQQVFLPQSRIYYYRALAQETPIPFDATILFQDAHLLVVDKPHFLPVTPSGRFVQETLLVRLKRQIGLEDLSPVHRIDRETAGLVLLSLRPQDRNAYQALFRSQTVEKTYEAIAPWRADASLPRVHRSRIEPDAVHFFRQCEVAGPANSETLIELLATDGARGLYRLAPRSGKTHQLRVHMNALGLPLEGDLFYPDVVQSRATLGQDDYTRPLQLLARQLSFTDPVTGAARHFESQRQLRWG